MTFNSVNKLAHGHADNFAADLLYEMVGHGVPVVVVPHCKPQLASHPVFGASLEALRGMGVRVLLDPDAPYGRRLPPWSEVINALSVRADVVAAQVGKTLEELAAWRPELPTRGRRAGRQPRK